MSDNLSFADKLITLATPYWETEAELTQRFFASKPSKKTWVRYLRAAVYKELNPVIGYGPTNGFACGLHMEFSGLVNKFEAVDDGLDRRSFRHRLEQMIEEFMHFTVLAEVLEDLLGRPLQRGDAEQLPEDEKLNRLRHTYVNSDNTAVQAVMELTEGGGTATFREGSKLPAVNSKQSLQRILRSLLTTRMVMSIMRQRNYLMLLRPLRTLRPQKKRFFWYLCNVFTCGTRCFPM